MRWLGQHLHNQGMTVYGPRMPGHGSDYHDLARFRWQDWYLAAYDGYRMLRETCDQVFVAGLSMGGLLTLLLAANEPLDGIVVMAAPLTLPNSPMLPYTRYLQRVMPYFNAPDKDDFPKRLAKEQARRGDPVVGRVRYRRWPTRAAAELYKLMQHVDTLLPSISVPALVLYSENDQTVPVINQQYVVDRLGSPDVDWHTYTASGHILPQDVDYPDVHARTAAFINAHRQT